MPDVMKRISGRLMWRQQIMSTGQRDWLQPTSQRALDLWGQRCNEMVREWWRTALLTSRSGLSGALHATDFCSEFCPTDSFARAKANTADRRDDGRMQRHLLLSPLDWTLSSPESHRHVYSPPEGEMQEHGCR